MKQNRIYFVTFCNLDDQKNSDEFVRQRLNERLFERIQKVEMKRMKQEREANKKMTKDEKMKSDKQKKKDELNDFGRRGKGKGVK